MSAVRYENLQIKQIQVIGNVPDGCFFDGELVTTRIKTRQGDLFSQTLFDNDLKVLAVDYDRVEPCFAVVEGKLVLTLKVWPKPMIRSIIWNGNCGIESKELQKELGICVQLLTGSALIKRFIKSKLITSKKDISKLNLIII